MSQFIVELLGVDATKFKDHIARLEHVALRPGVDIRLSTEILAKSGSVVQQLELDVQSATPELTYQALLQRLAVDEQHIIQKMGLRQGDLERNADKITTKITQLSSRDRCLGITSAGVRKLLKSVPPKKTLKALRLRSLESVIKRSDPRALYTIACLLENDSWRSQIHAKIRRLDSKDIQWQQVAAVTLPEGWYARVAPHITTQGAILVNQESSTVCVLPVVDSSRPGSTMLILGLALQAMHTMSAQSLPYRTQALAEGYTSVIPKIANGEHPELAAVHGIELTWSAVYELVALKQDVLSEHAVEFETFDLFWESTETKIAAIDSHAAFWVGLHFVGVRTGRGRPVSMHMLDVAASLAANAPYEQRVTTHLERSLWNELQIRYLSEEVIARTLASQLSKYSGTVIL